MEIAGLIIGFLGLVWAIYAWKHPTPTEKTAGEPDETDGNSTTINQNAGKIINIEEIQTAYINYGGKKIMKALGNLPSYPDVFMGRETSTKEIHQALTTTKNILLLVNGKGGIGKTTLASQYYYDYSDFYAHLIWVVSEKGIKEAIISLALSLEISFPEGLTQEMQINEILRNLSGLKKPVLFVLDNANDLVDLNKNYHLLRKIPNIHVLLTSRIDSFQHIKTYKVDHLDKETAIKLFKHHFQAFKSSEQELLEKILEAVGYNTLVIELLAKNMNEINTHLTENYPLRKLLEDIQQKGVLAISKSAKVSSGYKLKYARPEEIISTMYDISKLTGSEKQILSVFAVLPALSIPYEDLAQFFPKLENLDRILLKLSQKGWVDYDDKTKSFKTNPVISEIVKAQNKDKLEAHLENFLGTLKNKLDHQAGIGHIEGDFNEIKRYVRYAETFTNQTKFSSYNFSILYDRIGNFHTTYGNLDKALKYFEEGLNLSKQLYKSNPNNVEFKNGLASSYSILGFTHTSLGNLDKALKFFEVGLNLSKQLYKSNPNNVEFKNGLASSYSELGDTHTSLGNLDDALKYFEEGLNLSKQLYESNPNDLRFKAGLASSYSELGKTHTSLGNLDKALKYFEDFTNLMKQLYESNPNNVLFKVKLAISYAEFGSTHISLGNIDKAVKFFREGTELFEQLYEGNPDNVFIKSGLAASYDRLGDTHTSLGNLDKALKYFEEGLNLSKQLYENNPNNVKFKNSLAISYSNLGDTHTSLGNLDKALKYFEDYFNLKKQLFESTPNNVDFKNGLAISYEKLGMTHTSLGNLDKALKYFEDYFNLTKQLYESNPNNVGFKKELAISYELLGETHTSLGNLDKALKYFEDFTNFTKQLFESTPNNVEFKNGLAISYSKLGETHSSLGNLDKALKYFEDETELFEQLYKSHPNNVAFKNGLASSYGNLGVLFIENMNNTTKGLEFLNKAKKLLKELTDNHPKYIDFEENYNWVIEKLKSIE